MLNIIVSMNSMMCDSICLSAKAFLGLYLNATWNLIQFTENCWTTDTKVLCIWLFKLII